MSTSTAILASERVQLLDRGSTFIRWVERREADQMIRLREVEVLGTRRRIRAIRYLRPDGQEPDLSRKRFKLRQPGYGTAHRREQYDNPAGTWTIDRIPVTHRELFTTVLDECLKAA